MARPFLPYTADSFFKGRADDATTNASETSAMRAWFTSQVGLPGIQPRDYFDLGGLDGPPYWGTPSIVGQASDPIWRLSGTIDSYITGRIGPGSAGFHAPANLKDRMTGTSDGPFAVMDMGNGMTVFGTNGLGQTGNVISVSSAALMYHASNGLDYRNSLSNDSRNWASRGRIPDAMTVRRDLLLWGIANNSDLGHVLHIFWTETLTTSNFCHPLVGKENGNYGWGKEGQRLRLSASVNVETLPGLTPGGKVIARTLQRYGAYIGDNAGSGGASIHCDTNGVLNDILGKDDLAPLKISMFEVIPDGWTGTGAGSSPPPLGSYGFYEFTKPGGVPTETPLALTEWDGSSETAVSSSANDNIPKFVRQATAVSSIATTALVVSMTANVSGNALIANIAMRADTSRQIGSITDAAGNIWEQAIESKPGTGSATRTETWFALNASPTTSVTINIIGGAGIKIAANISEFSGVTKIVATDQTNAVSASTVTVLPTGSLMPTANNALIFAAINTSTAGGTRTFDSTSPWVELTRYATTGGSDVFGAAAYRVAATPSSVQAQWSHSSAVNYSGSTVALFGELESVNKYRWTKTVSTVTYGVNYYGDTDLALGDAAATTAIIVCHGTSRNAWDYANYAKIAARKGAHDDTTVVVAPLFKTTADTLASDDLYWDSGWREGAASQTSSPARSWSMSSYAVIDDLLTKITNATNYPNIKRVVLMGNSAGAQVMQRFAAGTAWTPPSGVSIRYVLSAPGSYMYLDPKRYDATHVWRVLTGPEQTATPTWDDYKYGQVNRNTYMSVKTAVAQRTQFNATKILYAVGALDNDPLDPDLDVTASANWQGTQRLDRMTNFYNHLAQVFGGGAYTNQSMSTISGIAHSARSIFSSDESVTYIYASESNSNLIVDSSLLASLPMSGTPWTTLLGVANGSLGTIDLVVDAQSNTPGKVFAAALVYKRTGTQSYKDKVVAVLDTFATASLVGSRVLNTGRQLAGLCAAADLVGYTDAAFMDRMDWLRTYTIGGHGTWDIIENTSEITSNNWGGWALASRTAMSAYLGDTVDVARCAVIYNAYFDRSVYSGWGRTADYDPTWSHNSAAFIPVNPIGYPGKSGAPVEDISRSAGSYPSYDATGILYSWEILGGLVLTARILEHNGYPTAWTWGDNGPLRITQFLKSLTSGWPAPFNSTQYISWEIRNHYGAAGVALGTPPAASYGRQFGFTDWLTV